MSYRFVYYEIEGYSALEFVGPDDLDEYYIPVMIQRRRNKEGEIDYTWDVGYPCDADSHYSGAEATMRKAKRAALDAAALYAPELAELLVKAKRKA